MPYLLSQSENESGIYLEDFIDSDSDDEVITSHYDPNFDQIIFRLKRATALMMSHSTEIKSIT